MLGGLLYTDVWDDRSDLRASAVEQFYCFRHMERGSTEMPFATASPCADVKIAEESSSLIQFPSFTLRRPGDPAVRFFRTRSC